MSLADVLRTTASGRPWGLPAWTTAVSAVLVYLLYIRTNLGADWSPLVPVWGWWLLFLLLGARTAAVVNRTALGSGAVLAIAVAPLAVGPTLVMTTLSLAVLASCPLACWTRLRPAAAAEDSDTAHRKAQLAVDLAAWPGLMAGVGAYFLSAGNFGPVAAAFFVLAGGQALVGLTRPRPSQDRNPSPGAAESPEASSEQPPAEAGWGLTVREQEVLELLKDHYRPEVIAARLGISVRTVHSHVDHIYRKAGVSGRVELHGKLNRGPEPV